MTPFPRFTSSLQIALALVVSLAGCSKSPPPPPAPNGGELTSVLIAGVNAYEQGAVKDALIQFERAAPLRRQADDAAQELPKHQEVKAGQLAGITNATFFEKCAHTAPLLPAVEAEQPDAIGIAVKFTDVTADAFGGVKLRGPAGIIDPE